MAILPTSAGSTSTARRDIKCCTLQTLDMLFTVVNHNTHAENASFQGEIQLALVPSHGRKLLMGKNLRKLSIWKKSKLS